MCFCDWDTEVVETFGGGKVCGCRVVVVVCEDSNGGWSDDGVAGDSCNIAESVAEGGLDEWIVVEF